MSPRIILESPYPFKERLLLFGGGGTGKTTAVLSVARRVPDAHFHVLDTDISYAYQRALALDFPDVEARGQITVHELDEWEAFVSATESVVEKGDHDKDFLVFDTVTWAWETVQAWMSDQVHGEDIADFMRRLRTETRDAKDAAGKDDSISAFNKQLTEGMNWPIINKEYRRKVTSRLQKWHGHFIMTAEATDVGRRDDEELKQIYGSLGIRPAGQKSLHHVAATNLFLSKRGHDQFLMTTVKDRNHREVEREPFNDFAMDYLKDVAGWRPRVLKGDKDASEAA